jgi:UDP-N-acetylglucosamine 2-epimerase (non-hydrolysing)
MTRARQKILIVLGTRPEAIKMAPVIHALKSRPDARPVVCLTGQHREMIEHHLPGLSLRADYELKLMRRDQDLKQLVERVLLRVGNVLVTERPDWVLVQGDSTTAMAASLAAFCHGVRIGHVEAGLRTHNDDDPFPEEVNRRLADTLAFRHFAPTQLARMNLLREGITPHAITVTGNPVIDVLMSVARRSLPLPTELARLPLRSKRIIVFTMHRRESLGKPLRQIAAAVRELASTVPDVHIACLAHRNPHVQNALRASFRSAEHVSVLAPLPYVDFIQLLVRSYFVMTDSGGLQEECPSLGKPVMVLRDVTERPEAIAAGASVLAGRDPQNIIRIAKQLLTDGARYRHMAKVRHIFGDGAAAPRIVKQLLS